MSQSETDHYFISKMGDTFTRQQLLKLTLEHGYSVAKCGVILETFTLRGQLERIAPGRYRKVKQK